MTDFIKDPETNAEILKDFKVVQPSVEKTQSETMSDLSPKQSPLLHLKLPAASYLRLMKAKSTGATSSRNGALTRMQSIPKTSQEMLHNRKSKLMTLNADYFGEKFDIEARLFPDKSGRKCDS